MMSQGLQSDSIAELAKALAGAQGKIESPLRTKEAKIQGETRSGSAFSYTYKYAPMEEVTRVIKEPLAECGLSWRQGVVADGDRIFIRTVIMHQSGEWFATDYPVHVSKPGAQGFAGGASYARRYGLTFALGIAAEDDDDANAADGNRAEMSPRAVLSPQTRGATRTAAPVTPEPLPAAMTGNDRPVWVDKFLSGSSYEIDPANRKGGWSGWEGAYLAICDNATDIDQITKLENDNGRYFPGFRENVRPEVYTNFRQRVEAAEKRLWREPDTSVLHEMSGRS